MKYNKLYRWFLTLMMSLPIISIAVRCIYVQKNENAYQSYYGETINQETYTKINSTDNLIAGNTYKVVNSSVNNQTMTVGENRIYVDRIFNYVGQTDRDFTNVKEFAIFTNNQTNTSFYFYDINSNFLFNMNGNNITYFEFSYLSNSQIDNKLNNTLYTYNIIYSISYNRDSFLDNAFEYSVNEFNNVGFNKVNFTRWFTDLFTNGDNIYTTFINSYCNYVLFSTCALALPYFLYWFITFVMGLMDRFGRKEIMR